MKKLFLSFAVVASFAMVSCGGEKAQDAAVVEEEVVEGVITEATDSLNNAANEVVDSLNNAANEVVDSIKG